MGAVEPAAKGQAPLHVADFDWTAGHKLAAFEILSELPQEGHTRKFSVRLTLDGVAGPREATYYVFGKSPIWISRDRDYAQMQSM